MNIKLLSTSIDPLYIYRYILVLFASFLHILIHKGCSVGTTQYMISCCMIRSLILPFLSLSHNVCQLREDQGCATLIPI